MLWNGVLINMGNVIKSGLKPDSVKNMMFGAGVLYKNFKYGTHYTPTFDKKVMVGKTYYTITGGPTGGTGYTEFTGDTFSPSVVYYEKYEGFGGDKIGATKEGTKVTITPEYTDIEVDGVLVKMEGLTRKVGEKAVIEATVVDMSVGNLVGAINGNVSYTGEEEIRGKSNAAYITTKSDIAEGDYITNLALAARRLDNNMLNVIVFKKALCTSGLELDMKNKNISGNKYTFEAFAECSDINTDTLPVMILSEKIY